MIDIKMRAVRSSSDKEMASAGSLYNRSFPREERRPWNQEMALVDSGMPFFRFLIATDMADGRFVGFATVWQLPGAVYIEHLAVDERLRSSGAGGKILDEIVSEAASLPVVVEVEPDEANEDAGRRIAFYERHGFEALRDFVYFQPPYAPGLPDVRLMLMATKIPEDLKAFVIMLHTLVYNQ